MSSDSQDVIRFGPWRRELAHRQAAGLDVKLYWAPGSDTLSVVVSDARLRSDFELVLGQQDDALEVFNHPYGFAAGRGLDGSILKAA
jgi:hypothetical protein